MEHGGDRMESKTRLIVASAYPCRPTEVSSERRVTQASVIAVCDVMATWSAFGELQRKGGRPAAAARACRRLATRGVSRQSRGASRLTRATRADTSTTHACGRHAEILLLLAVLATVSCARKSTPPTTFLFTGLASTSRAIGGFGRDDALLRSARRDVRVARSGWFVT